MANVLPSGTNDAPPAGPAGGDLTGTYPNPSVAKINGSPLGTTSGATTGAALVWNGSAWVPASGAIPGALQTATVTLTSAQVLAIFTTPVTIIPAPGAGLMIAPITAVFNYTYGGTAYTDGGGILQLFDSGGFQFASVTTNGFWTAAASRVNIPPIQSGGNQSLAANAALVVKQNTANPTLGNGTVTVTVAYMAVPVS